jgi:hypothetical protein
MSRKLLTNVFLAIALLMGVNGFSQPYQAIRKHVPSCYIANSAVGSVSPFWGAKRYYECIDIRNDSLSSDSVLYNFPVISADNDCFYPDTASWIGRKILIGADGDFIFFNAQSDTIHLKTLALHGDTFLFYRFANGNDVFAYVLDWDTLTVDGIPDSVKTFGFIVKNSSGVILPDTLSSLQIRLSKSYGLMTTFAFRDFPNDYTLYEFSGAGDLPGGTGVLTIGEVYDFEVGDEFHQRYVETSNGGIVKHILHKIIWPQDSVTYQVEQWKWQYFSGLQLFHTFDTITYSNLNAPVISGYFPNEVMLEDYTMIGLYRQYQDDVFQKEISSRPTVACFPDSCYHTWCPIYQCTTYYKGCGNDYFETAEAWNGYYRETKLLYFRKGSYEWGTPLTIPVGISEAGVHDKTDIFVEEKKLFIRSPKSGNNQINIFNVSGGLMFTYAGFVDNNFSIDIASFPAGVYVIRIAGESSAVVRKFVLF